MKVALFTLSGTIASTLKARLLLHVLLAAGYGREQIAGTFRVVGADAGDPAAARS